MKNLFASKRIMVIVAHPDDELLGLGATMNRLINEFDALTHVVILGEGITSRDEQRAPGTRREELKTHRENILHAQKAIGYQSVSIYEFPDNRFDTVALLDIIKVVEREKSRFNPDIVFTHHGGDVNIDHQRTFEAVVTACRPLSTELVNTIITFETPSGTEWRPSTDPRHFIPDFFVAVSLENIKAKIQGMESYAFEKRAYPHPRSPQALTTQAQRWGIAIGVPYAEAFSIVRSVLK